MEDRNGRTVIHLKLFYLPDPSDARVYTRAEAAAVKEFIRRFPAIFAGKYREKYKANPEKYGHHDWDDVAIELRQFSGIQVEGVENTLLAISGGVSPDVMYVNFRQSGSYISQRFLYPLDKPEDGYLSAMSEQEINFRIHPRIWPVIRRKGPDGAAQVWAIPWGGALGKVIAYRKDLFDEAGVPYPTNDWTWEDFLDKCRRLTNPSRGVYGFELPRVKHESHHWLPFLWSAGGDCMTYDEREDEWKCVFDGPEAAIALDFYTRLCTEPWADKHGRKRRGYAYKEPAGWTKWERGEIAMQSQYVDEKLLTTVNPDITGIVPVPIGPTGIRAAELNSRMMGIFAGIKNPVIRDAAWEYIRFYDSEDAMRIKTRVMVEGGLGSFINPRYLKMFGYEELIRLAPRQWAECFEIAINTGRPEPYARNSNVAYNLMTFPLREAEQLALAGKLPAERGARLEALRKILHKYAVRGDEEMFGIVPQGTLLWRRVTAFVVLCGIVAAFGAVFAGIAGIFRFPAVAADKKSGRFLLRHKAAYIMLVPAIASILFWQYVPLISGSIIAFQDYRIMGGSSWVWLDNFGNVLWDRAWWNAVWNSARYSALVISLTFLPPVILAILLQETPRGKVAFRTIFYFPAVVTSLVVVLLWKMFCEPSEQGVLNSVLMRAPVAAFLAAGFILFLVAFSFARRLFAHGKTTAGLIFLAVGAALSYTCLSPAARIFAGAEGSFFEKLWTTRAEPLRWLLDSDTAMLACVLPMVWAGMGPGCLIYLAALKGIADDYYEAADIDGASFVDKILFVVFPILRPLIVINFVGVFIGCWVGATGNILAMTGGAANTEVAGLHIFYKAFMFMRFGPAVAMAWMLAFMLIGFTVYQLRVLSRMEFKAADGNT